MTKARLRQSFGILERQMPITGAVGARSALEKMLQGFLYQFRTASFMFPKFDLAALQNSLILQQIFFVCELKFARVLRNCRSLM